MILRKRGNIILNEAKNAGDALVSTSIFNEMQDKICRLQLINGSLNMILAPTKTRSAESKQIQVPHIFQER